MNCLYEELYYAFNFFNKEFFNSELPEVIITLERNYRIKGYFSSNRFISRIHANKKMHEISLNPEYFGLYSVPEILSTLVHEMVHLEFYGSDKSQAKGYHSKKWASKMEQIGLLPTDTGHIGGNKTGYRITQLIIPGGTFDKLSKKMIENGFNIPWKDNIEKEEIINRRKKNKRIKYTCKCGNNIWAKRGLIILCPECKSVYNENK